MLPPLATAIRKQIDSLVETVANRAAPALENARLLEQTPHLAQRDRLIAEISAGMRTALDVDGILQTTVHEIRRVPGIHHGVIRLSAEALHAPVGNGQTDEGDDRNAR